MESNLTVTIFSEEYRDLIRAKCNHEIMLGLLIECMEQDWRPGDVRLDGRLAAKVLEQFAPMAYKIKCDEITKEQSCKSEEN